ncbi:sulfotransferase domain-containing protein [Ekhidna sp. To15]|uniref:sulfotransferase domain-containing protein n=1 Tax=Ekhidna sp. To15 TaxID=3395267 RepID=UPI003F5262B3
MGRTTHAIHNLEEYAPSKQIDTLIVTNSSIAYLEQIDFNRAFHVIRDPRDIVVSSYFSHLVSHKTDIWKDLLSHREQLKNLSKEEGLIFEIEDCRKQQFIDMANWNYNQPQILELKFEDFFADLDNQWRIILEHLGYNVKDGEAPLIRKLISHYNRLVLKLNEKFHTKAYSLYFDNFIFNSQVDQILKRKNYFERGGRKAGSEDISHHYRKGISGDWKNHFSEPIKECFKSNWGELLINLGYEEDMNW